MERERGVAGGDGDRLLGAPDAAPRGLLLDAGPDQGLDEAGRRAVESGRLGGVEFDEAVVDAEAGEGGEDVFDEADLDREPAERGPAQVPITPETDSTPLS